MELDLPKVPAFLCCHAIQQDVLNKNYEFRGVFQGFSPPAYPFGAEFMSFTRFFFEGEGEFRIDVALFDLKGTKITDTQPRNLHFKPDSPTHDLITAWRVRFPEPGTYLFKVFCNNLNIGESRIYCR